MDNIIFEMYKLLGTTNGIKEVLEFYSRISLAQTRYQFVQGETVQQMVATQHALAGVNAGGFVDTAAEDANGGTPAGLLLANGEIINSNGENELHSVIGFNQSNVLILGKMTPQEALDAGIKDCVDFKPYLIVNGEKVAMNGTGGWGLAPRTAIGQRQTGEVIFFCIDGRQLNSIGADLDVLQDTLYNEQCINASMLDGGSSSVMYYDGSYINNPSLGYERTTNNAWIIQ